MSKARQSARDSVWSHVNVLFGVLGAKYLHPNHKDLESLTSRINGKEGRVRFNITGKRVDYCSRSVIVPDPNMRPDQLRVPYSVASTLTVPITVTNMNVAMLNTEFARLHTDCVRSIVLQDGSVVSVSRAAKTRALCVGQTVNCPLTFACTLGKIHGAFNRQPTLHTGSFMGMELVVAPMENRADHCDIDGLKQPVRKDIPAFGMNPSLTAPFNADFDGDEMNLHVPQAFGSMAEVEGLMSVRQNMRADGKVQVAPIQDTIVAAYLATSPDAPMLERHDAELMLMQLPYTARLPVPAIVKSPGGPRWTPVQLISRVFPADFSYNWPPPASHFDAKNPKPSVRQGHMLCGRLLKAEIGPGSSGLLDSLYMYSDAMHCSTNTDNSSDAGPVDILHNLMRLLSQFSDWYGFSIGLDDAHIHDDSVREQIASMIESVNTRVFETYQQKHARIPGMTDAQTMQYRVASTISNVRQSVEELMLGQKSTVLSPLNALRVMSEAGTKGNALNTMQISCLLGLQHLGGARDSKNHRLFPPFATEQTENLLSHRGKEHTKRLSSLVRNSAFGLFPRSLPHFQPGDWRPDACMFIGNSLMDGLTPWQFWNHAMAGRKNLCDIPLATPVSGDLNRLMGKSNSDATVAYTGSVFTGDNIVAQFSVYNGVGDMAKLKRYQLKVPLDTIWSDTSILSRETIDVLRVFDKSGTAMQTASSVMRQAVALCLGRQHEHAPPSVWLCACAQKVMVEIAIVLADAVVGVQSLGLAHGRPEMLHSVTQVGLDVAADIFAMWYVATIAREMLCYRGMDTRDILDWSMRRPVTDSEYRYSESVLTLQPIDIAVVAATTPIYYGPQLTRHSAVLAVMNMTASLIPRLESIEAGEWLAGYPTVDTPIISTRCMLAVELMLPKKLAVTTPALLDRIVDSIERAVVHPGKAVGSLASLGICEPGTQMTLDTFTSAGQDTAGLSGLSRLIELCRKSTSSKPSMVIRMRPPIPPLKYATERQKLTVKHIMDAVVAVHMRDIISEWGIYYLPGAWTPVMPCDVETMQICQVRCAFVALFYLLGCIHAGSECGH